MSVIDPQFDQRLRRVVRKHRRMSENGVVRRMGADGLVMEYPRRRLPQFPWRAVVLLIVIAFVFKAWMFAALGAAEYGTRVDRFAAGNLSERAAAWVLQPEPATQFVAGLIDRLGF